MNIIFLKIAFLVLLFLCCYGFLFNIALIICQAPGKRTHKALTRIAYMKENRKTRGINELNRSIAEWIARTILSDNVMNPYRKALLETKLRAAHMDTTAEIYTAENIVLLLECLIAAVLLWFILPFMSILCAVLGIYGYIRMKNRANRMTSHVQREIELDLPRFVYAVKEEMPMRPSVIDLLEKHKSDYTKYWENEMNITLADMKSGNYEIALSRLEARVGSSNLSEVTRGLIEMSKGNDTKVYWEALAIRFSEYRKQELMRQVEKIPGKVHSLSFGLLFCVLAIYAVTFITMMFESLHEIGF